MCQLNYKEQSSRPPPPPPPPSPVQTPGHLTLKTFGGGGGGGGVSRHFRIGVCRKGSFKAVENRKIDTLFAIKGKTIT